ncbi:MAG: hypothetical protein M3162_06565 [Thermoproteota archaeon]|nr:hypothetical protein [Thermoproteota archaeon]
MRETNCNSFKSPKLKAVIVEPILISRMKGISISELLFEIQSTLPLSKKTLKRYLFYLINYELVSYNGQRKAYLTEEGGVDLLQIIIKEKKTKKIASEDIVITLESELC